MKDMSEEEFKEMMDVATEVAKHVASTLITKTDGQGHLITAVMAMVMAGLERQHAGTIKDVMSGAVLLGLAGGKLEMADAPPDAKLN